MKEKIMGSGIVLLIVGVIAKNIGLEIVGGMLTVSMLFDLLYISIKSFNHELACDERTVEIKAKRDASLNEFLQGHYKIMADMREAESELAYKNTLRKHALNSGMLTKEDILNIIAPKVEVKKLDVIETSSIPAPKKSLAVVKPIEKKEIIETDETIELEGKDIIVGTFDIDGEYFIVKTDVGSEKYKASECFHQDIENVPHKEYNDCFAYSILDSNFVIYLYATTGNAVIVPYDIQAA